MGRGGARTRLDLRLALVLPALVVVSCFAPLIGLLLRSLSPWVSAAFAVSVAVAVCFLLLRNRGNVRALVLSTLGVLAGTGGLALVSLGLRVLVESGRDNIANAVVTALPLVLIALAAVAIAWCFISLIGQRRILAAAWALAFATPFALAGPIGKLSDAAGNAGMDVVALFVLPLAAFFAWAFVLIGTALWSVPPSHDAEPSRIIQSQSS